jgi:hypothetical protein|tara:strand:+ start:2476 stop:3177 length:702 start_codon:yes stop_codon:yes gene_type:complete
MNYLIKILILISFSFNQNTTNEKLFYDINFRIFSAGEATFESHITSLDNNKVYKIVSKTKSNKFLDRFYKIRDQIDIWIDKDNYSLLKINKKIKEGNYKRNFSAIIDQQQSIAIYKNKTKKVPKIIFDPIAAIYYYRTLNLNKNNQYNFFTFDEGKIKEIILKVTDIENVKTPMGKFQCFVLKPFSTDGKKLFKNDGHMTIWISNDEKRLPIKIEQNTNIGKLVLNLKNYNNF